MSAANTWFQQKESARYTWRTSDGVTTRNQIDYILNTRFRKCVINAKRGQNQTAAVITIWL